MPGDAVDRGMQLTGVELRRRSGGKDELARGRVEFTVAHAEGVAGEYLPGIALEDAEVVQGMARGMQELERAPAEPDPLAVLDRRQALGRNRQDGAVLLEESRCPVDRLGRTDQLRGVDHMRRAARMHENPGVRQQGSEPSCAARVIEMHVSEKNVIDLIGVLSDLGEGAQQMGH